MRTGKMTRVLVLAGLVTLASTQGEITGSAGELLASDGERAPEKVSQSNNAFGLALYKQLAQREQGKNLFISPYSVTSALAMTYEGARGDTRAAMAKTLRWPTDPQTQLPWQSGRIHGQMAALTKALAAASEDPKVALHVANALWGDQTTPFRAPFLAALKQAYDAPLFSVDFRQQHEAARQRINQWVAEHTEQKIQELLAKGTIDASTALVLTNAIYFKAEWAVTFDAKKTRERGFTLADGSHAEAEAMYAKRKQRYGEVRVGLQTVQLVELPYAGEKLSMVIALPQSHDGLPALERQLTDKRLEAWIGKLRERKITLTLPKFELDMASALSLKSPLIAMGMGPAFGAEADFSGMCDQQLFISDVLHKTYVKVDEQGTEAAAATAVVMKRGAAPGRPPVMHCDRPFLFLIRDVESGAVLFVGRLQDPR